MINYYIVEEGSKRALLWFSCYEGNQSQCDIEVEFRRPLLKQNSWSVFRTPPMDTMPDVIEDAPIIAKHWDFNEDLTQPKLPPYSYAMFIPRQAASFVADRTVAYYLGMWPMWEDYVQRPNDPNIWPIRGLIVAASIRQQPQLRKEIDYKWRTIYRHKGWRNVPGGVVPLHFIDECYYIDWKRTGIPALYNRGCNDRGLPWTEFESTVQMTF